MPYIFDRPDIVLVVRKYYELTGGTGERWVKFYKEKLLSSMNFKHCNYHERAIYWTLFTIARDDEFCGKIVYPGGKPIPFENKPDNRKSLIDEMNLPKTKGGRMDLIKDALMTLIEEKGLIYAELTDKDGFAIPSNLPSIIVAPKHMATSSRPIIPPPPNGDLAQVDPNTPPNIRPTSGQPILNSQLNPEIRPLISHSKDKNKIIDKDKEYTGPEALSFIMNLWNETTTKVLPSIIRMTSGRRSKLMARIAEQPDGGVWREVIARMVNTPFLRGENDRGWKADIDWLIKNPENFIRVLEGKYESGTKNRGNSPQDHGRSPGYYDH